MSGDLEAEARACGPEPQGPYQGRRGPQPQPRGSGVKRGRREGPSSGPAWGAQAGSRGSSASAPSASPEPAPSSPLLARSRRLHPHGSPGRGRAAVPFHRRGTSGTERTGVLPQGPTACQWRSRDPHRACAPSCWAACTLVTLGRGRCPPALASLSAKWVREACSASLIDCDSRLHIGSTVEAQETAWGPPRPLWGGWLWFPQLPSVRNEAEME